MVKQLARKLISLDPLPACSAMEFEELLAGVEQVLFACGTQYVSGDYEVTDSILSELERFSGMLSSYISSILYLEQEQPPCRARSWVPSRLAQVCGPAPGFVAIKNDALGRSNFWH